MHFIDQYGLVPYKPWQLSRYTRDGACEVCGITREELATRYTEGGYQAAPCSVLLNFDHCHEHGWIRGRLCTACNTEMSLAVRVGWIQRDRRRDLFLAHLRKCPDCPPAAPEPPQT